MKKTLFALLTLPLLWIGCTKDDDGDVAVPGNSHANTVLGMTTQWSFGTDAFHLDSLYSDEFGHLIKITEVSFYLGQPWFLNDVGDTVANFPAKYFLVSAADGGLIRTIGEVDAHLHEVNWTVGLDSVSNHSDPSTAAAPLNDFLRWWGWNDGRVFLRVTGHVDTDGNNIIDANDGDIVYDCGTEALKKSAFMQVHTDADQGGNVVLPFNVDVKRILQGIDVAANTFTHTTDNPTLALLLMNNLSASITHVE